MGSLQSLTWNLNTINGDNFRMILSNQVECNKCGDKPYSAHRHDFKHCKCGWIAVDGGMEYLKRSGNLVAYKEMSIDWDDEVANACLANIQEMMDSGRNNLGILCGIARTLRDSGYCISKML